MRRLPLTLLALMVLSSDVTGAPEPGAHVMDALEDGVPILYLPTAADSSLSSLRIVVRTGSFQEPPGKSGMAHLLEHLIFHGSYRYGEDQIWREVRRHGGILNAFTSTNFTIYSLDAPHDAFADLSRKFLSVVTNPALRLSNLEPEKEVVTAEQRARNLLSIMEVLDAHVFQNHRGETVIGTRESRKSITLEDLTAFYAQHYTPSNMSLVVVARAPLAAVKPALEAGFMLPPDDGYSAPADDEKPLLPMDQKSRSWATVTLFGYHLPEDPAGVCPDVAVLIEARLRTRLLTGDPIASDVAVICHRSRGKLFLLAFAFARNLLGSNIPLEMEEVFLGALKKPPSSEEQSNIRSRAQAQLTSLRHRSEELATMLSILAVEEPTRLDAAVRQALALPQLAPAPMKALMQRGFRPKQQVIMHFSPFEG